MANPYKALFNPLDTLRVTCAEGYNVCGIPRNTSRTGHLYRAAVDQGGESGATMSWLHEPADIGPALKCTKIWTSQNVCFFETTEPVILSDGRIAKACLELIHMSDADYKKLGMKTGKVFAAGDDFYREGVKGTTANHVHLQVGIGTAAAIEKNAVGAWRFKDELHPYRALWLHQGVKIGVSNYKYQFIYWPGEPIGEVTIGANYKRRTGPGTGYSQRRDASGNYLTAEAGTYAVWAVKNGAYCIRPACKQAYGGSCPEEWICCGSNGAYKKW